MQSAGGAIAARYIPQFPPLRATGPTGLVLGPEPEGFDVAPALKLLEIEVDIIGMLP